MLFFEEKSTKLIKSFKYLNVPKRSVTRFIGLASRIAPLAGIHVNKNSALNHNAESFQKRDFRVSAGKIKKPIELLQIMKKERKYNLMFQVYIK